MNKLGHPNYNPGNLAIFPGGRSGFSLVEIILTVMIGSFIILSSMRILTDYNKLFLQSEENATVRSEVINVLRLIRLDLQQAGSDPSPRRSDVWFSAGFALGRLSDTLSVPRGILPIRADALTVLSYRPWDADTDGANSVNEGLCLIITRIDSESFTSSDSLCYPSGTTIGTTTDYIPLKSISRDNILYTFNDCDSDGTKDCLVFQNLGDYRSDSDDKAQEVLLSGISSFSVYYRLDDGRLVYFDEDTGMFNDGSDGIIPFGMKDTIESVIIVLSLADGDKIRDYRLEQHLNIKL